MPTPAFDPNANYSAVAFDPGASYDAVPQHDFSSLTANVKGEGTYKIKTHDGQTLDVPYSNVPMFTQAMQGTSFASPDEQSRFEKDAANDPKRPTFWNALTNPVGSGGRDQGIVGGALQVGGQAIKALVQPVVHPIDTIKGVAKTGLALASQNPAVAGQEIVGPIVENYMSDKAAGGHALALENLGGQVLGGVEGGRMLGAVAPTVAKVAPTAASRVLGRAALLGKTPEAAYESAMKPSTALSAPERASIVQTGLENEIPISKAGLEKLGDRIDALNSEIKAQIDADPNRPIDPNAVATRADLAKAKFAKQVNARGDLAAIEASRQQFLDEQGAQPATETTPAQPAPPMGAADAQEMKQGTYRVLRGKYGEQGSASTEAQKALARGLKEEIAVQFPEINKLNATESRLLDLQPVLERAVNRISNHQAFGIGTPITGTAIKATTGSTGAGAVAMTFKAVLDNPAVKSRLAIAVSKANKIPFSQASAQVQAYSESLGAISGAPRAYSSGDTPNQ